MSIVPPALLRHPPIALGIPVLLYLAGLNPYFIPDIYDNVTYYFSAQSIAEDASYSLQNDIVLRWPPMFPAALALLRLVGLGAVIFAKLFVIGTAAASIWLVYRIWQSERRPGAVVVSLLFGLLPWSLMLSSAILSEWPCMAVSFLFLLGVPKLAEPGRPLYWAAGLGVLLGVASLTRWVAVLLGAALVAQAVQKLFARRGLKSILPELVAGGVGALLFVLWLVVHVRSMHHIPGFDLPNAVEVIDVINPIETARQRWVYELPRVFRTSDRMINALFFHSHPLVYLDLQDHPITMLALFPALLIVLGVCVRASRRELEPSDWYALSTGGLFGYFALDQMRYWVPIVPFLIHYMFIGLQALVNRVARRPFDLSASRALHGLVGLWMAWLVAVCMLLLVHGNSRNYRGLSVLSSPTAESFYVGYWRNMYEISKLVRERPELAPVCILGHPGAIRYVLAFSGRRTQHYPPKGEVGSLMVIDPAPLPAELVQERGLQEVGRSGRIRLLQATRQPEATPRPAIP